MVTLTITIKIILKIIINIKESPHHNNRTEKQYNWNHFQNDLFQLINDLFKKKTGGVDASIVIVLGVNKLLW